jgi:hypothetical protein
MKDRYIDIRGRINEEPAWYDENGAPRYGEFTPDNCPNIYSGMVILVRIACQDCGEEFNVEMHAGGWSNRGEFPPKKWHYGDPPAHGCVGDTMNCIDVEVLQVWKRAPFLSNGPDWNRVPELEGVVL